MNVREGSGGSLGLGYRLHLMAILIKFAAFECAFLQSTHSTSGSVGIRQPSVACSGPGQPTMADVEARGHQNRNDRPGSGDRVPKSRFLYVNLCKKKLFRAILIARDTIIARVQGSAGRHVWPDPCLESEMLARCHVCRVGQRCPVSVTLP